jgi:proteasome lid subunit RPN8/RPN11
MAGFEVTTNGRFWVTAEVAKPSSCGSDGIRASRDESATLTVRASLFVSTLRGLQEHSASWRESAAIWVGHVNDGLNWIAEDVYFHHKLCNDLAGPLSLELSEPAKYRLYADLASKGLRLIALPHTHPDEWVDLSEIDRTNQLCSRLGFWSIVIPRYADKPWMATRFGVHVRTERGWKRLKRAEVGRRIIVES